MAVYRRPQVGVVGVTGAPEAGLRGVTGSVPATPAAASATTEVPSIGEVLGGIVLFVLGLALALVLPDSIVKFTAPEGIGAFAVFYVVALTIERFLEFLDPPIEGLLKSVGRRPAKPDLKVKRDLAIESAEAPGADPSKPKDAATAQAEVNKATAGRSAGLAGLAGGLGIVVADYFNADFLTAIGITGAVEWISLAATGLVIAGGSKQLHDLLTNVAKASDQRSTPASTGGTSG